MDNNNKETNNIDDDFTNCNTSIVCDSESLDNNISKEKSKSIYEVFQETQELFIKLNKIFYISNKNLCYLKINQFPQEDFNIESTQSSTFSPQHLLCKNQNNINNKSYNYLSDNEFQKIFQISKIIWFDLLHKEFAIQSKSSNPMKKKFRSRKNTEDSLKKINIKKSFKDELSTRKLKAKNIIEINDYLNLNLKKKEKVMKFIDEYDQVKNEFTQQDLTYENVLKKCENNKNLNFEQAILNQLEANANTQQAVKMADYMKNKFVFF